jgi:hypothetical protein
MLNPSHVSEELNIDPSTTQYTTSARAAEPYRVLHMLNPGPDERAEKHRREELGMGAPKRTEPF